MSLESTITSTAHVPTRSPSVLARRPDAVKVAPRTCEVVFDRAYKDDLFVSDHFGVATEFGQIVKGDALVLAVFPCI